MAPQPEAEEDMSVAVELRGCGSWALFNPTRIWHRYFVLIFICFLSFGSYFCFDNPAALQKHILGDMKVNQGQYMQLYALYSWPNVVLCFFGGYLLDRVFGIRLGTVIFSLFICAGQVVFATGALFDSFILMEAGRFIFGIGGESLAVAQNTYAVSWFKGKELNMVFGLQLSFSRVGSTLNMNVMSPLYDYFTQQIKPKHGEGYKVLGWSLMFGFLLCLLSTFSALTMGFLDRRAAKILRKADAKTGEVIRFRDIKDFPLSVWLIFLICVTYYVAVFPFIGLGLVFFQAKYDLPQSSASVVNSLVYLISAGASPVLGFMVDKLGYNVYFLIVAIIMTIGGHAIMAFTFLTPYLGMTVMGVAYSLLACALWPLVAMVIPTHQLGTAYGFMQSIQNLGLALVSMLAGSIVDAKGYLVLEVFFLACLSIALICGVLLYLIDLSQGNFLNMSARERNRKAAERKSVTTDEYKPLLEDYYTAPPKGVSAHPIQPASAAALRNRFLARLGGSSFQVPDTFKTSAFAFPHVLR